MKNPEAWKAAYAAENAAAGHEAVDAHAEAAAKWAEATAIYEQIGTRRALLTAALTRKLAAAATRRAGKKD